MKPLRWSVALVDYVTWDTRLENQDAIHQALYGGIVERLPLSAELARLNPQRLTPARARRRGTERRRPTFLERLWDAVAGGV